MGKEVGQVEEEEGSSSDSSDSNITSELSDDQTFDDSVCDEDSNSGGVEVQNVESSAVKDTDYITNTPWYSEWAPRLVLRYPYVADHLLWNFARLSLSYFIPQV